jgi:effector-binding domain-containing protein
MKFIILIKQGSSNKEDNSMVNALSIETNKSIKLENVASFRKIMRQSEISIELGKFIEALKGSGAEKNGPMITVTFAVDNAQGEAVVDMEFLIPLNKPIELGDNDYKVKKTFHLVHAVTTRFRGDPSQIQQAYDVLIKYIHDNKLQQITAAYNVNLNDEKINEGEIPIYDIYIGVNPSVL